MWTTIIYTVYHTYIPENWKEVIKPTFFDNSIIMTILTFYVYALFVVFWLLFLSFLKLRHLFLLQRDADVYRKIQDFVLTKGGIICQLPQKKLDAVIIVLLGCFYVFNVSYTQCKAILTFLDQALLESGLGQTLVNVSSLFQWLGKYLSSCWM